MINYYENILTPEECDKITRGMDEKYRFNHLDKNQRNAAGSLGFYDLPETLPIVNRLTELLSKDYTNISFLNTYTRIYFNGNKLLLHTDRKDLDLTLTVCTYSNVDYLWPIWVSKIYYNKLWDWNNNLDFEYCKSMAKEYVTPVGSGVSCIGNRNPHWRDPLVCSSNQFIVQTFYHWKFNGT